MKYFKGFDKDLKCYNGFQYEVGKVYDTGYNKTLTKDDICTKHVIHFCDSVEDVDNYYPLNKNTNNNRLCEVEPIREPFGEVVSYGDIYGTNKIKIVREITGGEFDYLTGNSTCEMLNKRFQDEKINYNSIFLIKKFLFFFLTLFKKMFGIDRIMITKIGCKYNFCNKFDSVLFPNIWFDSCFSFHDGYASVEINGKWNFIDKKGNYISDKWYDDCFSFHDGYAPVKLNNKWNYINRNGKLISEPWFDACCSDSEFHEDCAAVELNGKLNYINRNGKLISEQWFDYGCKFHEDYAMVELNEKWNYLDKNGNLISDKWFDYCYDFFNGYAIVKLNGKYNYINRNGKLISDIWFKTCLSFQGYFSFHGHKDYAAVELNYKWNYIDKNGKLISELWFDYYGYDFFNEYAAVMLNGKRNYIDKNGKLIYERWLDHDHYKTFNEVYFQIFKNKIKSF